MSQDTLRQLTALCQQLRDAQREQQEAEDSLKVKKANVRRLEEEDIPALMSELGVQKIQLDTGEVITVGLEVYAEFSKTETTTKASAFSWLEENECDGIIKTEVMVQFGRGEIEKAKEFAQGLEAQGMIPTLERNIHPQTLKAFIKERLADGKAVPLDMFGATSVNKAKVK